MKRLEVQTGSSGYQQQAANSGDRGHSGAEQCSNAEQLSWAMLSTLARLPARDLAPGLLGRVHDLEGAV